MLLLSKTSVFICQTIFIKHNITDCSCCFFIKEKQLKKLRAKQKRLQAILGGEDTQRVEAELLADDDGEEGSR